VFPSRNVIESTGVSDLRFSSKVLPSFVPFMYCSSKLDVISLKWLVKLLIDCPSSWTNESNLHFFNTMDIKLYHLNDY
jgi:hypothetical protein